MLQGDLSAELKKQKNNEMQTVVNLLAGFGLVVGIGFLILMTYMWVGAWKDSRSKGRVDRLDQLSNIMMLMNEYRDNSTDIYEDPIDFEARVHHLGLLAKHLEDDFEFYQEEDEEREDMLIYGFLMVLDLINQSDMSAETVLEMAERKASRMNEQKKSYFDKIVIGKR